MLKCGVVGVGSLGQHHARIFNSIPGVRLVGVSDLSEERGRGIADKNGVPFFQDYRELIPEVDCVSVAVPTTDHLTVCRPFLEAGRHVLVEKPIASSVAEAREMIRLAAEREALLLVGHLERFNPALLAVRHLITEPKFFEIHRLGVFVPRSLDVDVVLDLMIHDLDMVLHLTGSRPVEIRAVGVPVITGKIDIANVRLQFGNGAVANLTASRVSTEKVRKIRFFQPDSFLSVDLGRQTAAAFGLQSCDSPLGKEIVTRQILVEPGEPLRHEIEAFVRSIAERKRLGCTGEEGLAALEVAHEILRAIHPA